MRLLPSLTLVLAGLLLAGCHLLQPAQKTLPLAGGIPVGQVAPDIAGEDLDGVRFKLSDYRGKVVALVFWGTWCPPCKAMLPHERALAARLSGQPFVLLSVNSDSNRETVKHFATAKNLTWRMWWDGAVPGPIVQQYHVQSWPTIYVLDDHGVVRYRPGNGPQLDEAVDALLRELPANRH